MEDKLSRIRNLVGKVTSKELRYVDSFVSDHVGLFMPAGGACFYAQTPLHTHPSYMFVLPFNDIASIKIKDRISKTVPGRLFALSPGIPHHELQSDSRPRYIAVFIEKAFFEKQLSDYKVEGDVSFQGDCFEPSSNLLQYLKQFMIEADNKMPGAESVLYGISLELCHSIIRSFLNFKAPNESITQRIEIDRAVEFIHSDLSRKLKIQDMAEVACMSSAHFIRIFKKEIGKTPCEYLNEIRMDMVKKLLMTGDKSITEIAFECGFASPSYLSSSFSKKYRISPRNFLKTLKKQNF
ncbi:MAG: helix-turn-helix transcriptional regulator [Deltaproteobacteria bacterium]|nr:helix-turn-helix transcriptional regulator [Deltaproteobacteria bacterium]